MAYPPVYQAAVTTPEMVHRAVGISNADSIKVAVRVRPLNSKQVTANVSESVTVVEVCSPALCVQHGLLCPLKGSC
jgi:hypothetical protein